jgi:hypothetical protein
LEAEVVQEDHLVELLAVREEVVHLVVLVEALNQIVLAVLEQQTLAVAALAVIILIQQILLVAVAALADMLKKSLHLRQLHILMPLGLVVLVVRLEVQLAAMAAQE